ALARVQRSRREAGGERFGLGQRGGLHERQGRARGFERGLERAVDARAEPALGRTPELIEGECGVERRGNQRQREQRERERGAEGHRAARPWSPGSGAEAAELATGGPDLPAQGG